MSPNPRRCLIFDFDGVLVDSEPLHFESWQQAFDQLMGIRIEGNHHLLVGLTQEEIYRLWSGSQITSLTDDLRQALLDLKKQTFLTLAAELQPMPGSIDLLRRAQSGGWYTAIASRALRLRLHLTLEIIKMPPLFDVILGNEDVVNPVSDRKIHARAAQMYGIDPHDCVVIEDSVSGIKDALVCGIGTVIGLTSSLEANALEQAGAHQVVAHLDEVLP